MTALTASELTAIAAAIEAGRISRAPRYPFPGGVDWARLPNGGTLMFSGGVDRRQFRKFDFDQSRKVLRHVERLVMRGEIA